MKSDETTTISSDRISLERISEIPTNIKQNTKTSHIALIVGLIAILQLTMILTHLTKYSIEKAFAAAHSTTIQVEHAIEANDSSD